MLLGPVAALTYTTLATYCFTEEISLKKVFKKAFNPIIVASRKVGSAIRNNKFQILGALGIGVVGAMIGVPMAGFLAQFFGPILGSIAGSVIAMGMLSLALNSFIRKQEIVRNTNSHDSQLVKKLLNIIYENEERIARFHKKHLKNKYDLTYYQERDPRTNQFVVGSSIMAFARSTKDVNQISPAVLGRFFGTTKNPIQGWINQLEDSGFVFGKGSYRDTRVRNIRLALKRMLDYKGLSDIYMSAQHVISDYIKVYLEEASFVTKLMFLVDEYISDDLGIVSDKVFGSSYLGQSNSYLAMSRLRSSNQKQYEDYSKYFKLLVNIIMLTKNQPQLFKGKGDEFVKKTINLVFDALVDSRQITDDEFNKVQIETISYILYALTIKRFEELTDLELDLYRNKNNPKGLVTISDLSRLISETGDHRHLIAEQLTQGRVSLQLIEVIDYLQRSSQDTKSACDNAISKVRNYMEKAIELAKDRKSRNSRIGTYAHLPLELLTIKFLASMGIFSSQEVQMFPLKTRADLILLRDNSFVKGIEQKNFKNIPSLAYNKFADRNKIKFIAIDFTMTAHYGDIYRKCSRGYQGEDRYLFVVLYGRRDSKFVNSLNIQIKNDPSIPYSTNVEVISIEDYYTLLGFNEDTKGRYKTILRAVSSLDLEFIIDEYIKAKEDLRRISQLYEGWVYFDRFLGKGN